MTFNPPPKHATPKQPKNYASNHAHAQTIPKPKVMCACRLISLLLLPTHLMLTSYDLKFVAHKAPTSGKKEKASKSSDRLGGNHMA